MILIVIYQENIYIYIIDKFMKFCEKLNEEYFRYFFDKTTYLI